MSVVRDRSALIDALERARNYDRTERGECLVQTFVGGRAIGVETFFSGGRLRAAFVMDDQFIEGFVSPVGHSLPSDLGAAAQETIRAAVVRFARSLDITVGPANFDVRFDGETTLLEVNARLGGNSITDLVRVAGRSKVLNARTILRTLASAARIGRAA